MGTGFGNGYQTYNNIIDQLWLQGITQSRAFSIDLARSITFGGIDTMKSAGPLVAVPIISWHDVSSLKQQYYVYLTSVRMTSAEKFTTWTNSSFQQNVILDTGLWISLLPQDLVTSVISGFLSVVSQAISCSYISDKTTTVDFGFAGITIRAPIHEFMYYDGTLCWFRAAGIPAGQQAYLGAVYDQDNMNIWLAQAARCGTNLVAIGSGSGAVKSTTGACGVPTTSITTSSSTTPTVLPQSTTYVIITSISSVTFSTTLPGQTLALPSPTITVAKTTVSKTTTKTQITTVKTTTTNTTTKACNT
ncbi:acid protease [Acephala macrosclerotiorum]|nr:acid protease [Acephala macrosclerotiorum]